MTRLLSRKFDVDKVKLYLSIYLSIYVVCMSYGGDVRSTTFYDQQTADYIKSGALNFNIIAPSCRTFSKFRTLPLS